MKYLFKIILIFFFINVNFAKAQNIDSLFLKLEKTSHKEKKAIILLDIADAYRHNGTFTKSDSCIKIAFDISDANNYKERKSVCYNYWGINADINGNYSESYVFFEKALNIAIELNDSSLIASFYENLGIVLKDDGKYKKAINMQLKALKIRENSKEDSRLSSSYLNIGRLFFEINDTIKREQYTRKALRIAKSDSGTNFEQYASIYNEMGNIFSHETNIDSALYFYQLSYKYSEKSNWLQGKAAALGNIASIYYKIEDYENALKTINKSIIQSNYSGDILSKVYDLTYKARIYLKIDNAKKAEQICNQAYEICIENNFYSNLIDINKLFSEIYEKQGNYKKALRFHEKHKEISDSVYSANRTDYMQNLEKKYQTELKEQEIRNLSVKNKTQNILLIVIIIVFVLISIIVVSFIFIRKKRQTVEFDTLKQKLFRAQLNPHFLFNVLGSIQSFMNNNDAKKATFYLGNFASLIRSILNNSQKELISLDDEIQTLNNYTELENMQISNQFLFTIKTDEDMETEFILIPPMLLQPFIENAIKHAFNNEINKPKIEIKFTELNNLLDISIIDNGIGINNKTNKQTKQKGHQSFALKLFEERIKSIQQNLKQTIKYSIVDLSENESKQQGTKVNIKLPIIYS